MLQGLKTTGAYKVLAQCEAHIKHQVRVSCRCYQFHDDVEDDNSSPCCLLLFVGFLAMSALPGHEAPARARREAPRRLTTWSYSGQFPPCSRSHRKPRGIGCVAWQRPAPWWPYLGPLAVVTLENFPVESRTLDGLIHLLILPQRC